MGVQGWSVGSEQPGGSRTLTKGYEPQRLFMSLAGHLHQDEGEEGRRKKARGSTEQGWVRWGCHLWKGWICRMKLRGLCTMERALREPPGNKTSGMVPEFLLHDATQPGPSRVGKEELGRVREGESANHSSGLTE